MKKQKCNVLDEHCPSRKVLDRIAGKWTSLVIYALADGTLRYGELQRRIGGVSQKMLTQTLRSLEEDNLVTRKVYPVVPPMVEYSLTPLGRTLIEPLTAIRKWAEAHPEFVQRRRQPPPSTRPLPTRTSASARPSGR
ncbi:MAG TPA: helix-turn-helix domain-containing protein [Thermoanaerobaculia bacterium]|nr:helix-turn-helix domain-containing protein [Thermoanaerobaculia bacterium]